VDDSRALQCTQPSQYQDKTTLSGTEEASGVLVDPERVREERAEAESSSTAFGDELRAIVAATGRDPSRWSDSAIERVKRTVADRCGVGELRIAYPLLLELAHRGSVLHGPDAYLAGWTAEQLRTHAQVGRRHLPTPEQRSPLDELDTNAREALRATTVVELIERGDIPETWEHEPERADYETRIRAAMTRRLRARSAAA
jgi:hypothetical protein